MNVCYYSHELWVGTSNVGGFGSCLMMNVSVYNVICMLLFIWICTLYSVLNKYPTKFIGCCLANQADDGSGLKQFEHFVLKVWWFIFIYYILCSNNILIESVSNVSYVSEFPVFQEKQIDVLEKIKGWSWWWWKRWMQLVVVKEKEEEGRGIIVISHLVEGLKGIFVRSHYLLMSQQAT